MMLLKVPTQIRTVFTCQLCGHQAPVDYHDPAPIDEREPVPGKDRHAREQAINDANAKLEKQAQKALRIVRCPACGRLDGKAVRKALLQASLPVVALAPGLFMGGVIGTALLAPALLKTAPRLPVMVGALLVLVLSPLVLLHRYRQLRKEATRSAHFLPPAPPA